MKFSYWRGYAEGYLAGYAASEGNLECTTAMLQDNFERTLAVLREQLADAQALAREHAARADGAVDQLLLHLGARAISSLGAKSEERRLEQEVRAMSSLADDPTADRPIGAPGGRYGEAKYADLLGEDPTEQ